MRYRISLSDEAERSLTRLPGNFRQRVRRLIESLATDPSPRYAQELRDRPNHYRIRLDPWRIIYRIDDEAETVAILGVRRKTGPETYENLN
jgi:mRNA interferase RelE/StbE